jgi:hypothetical protein
LAVFLFPMLLLSLVASLGEVTREAITFFGPRTVWCELSPTGTIAHISAVPDGPEIPHGATMTNGTGAWAYYYPNPTRVLEAVNRLRYDPGTALLIATGRETTTASGTWREFRRCSEEEFEAAAR